MTLFRQLESSVTVTSVGGSDMVRQTGRESDKFMLRLPEGMREQIKALADRSGRSMNAEIVGALSDWLDRVNHHVHIDRDEEQESDVTLRTVRTIEDVDRAVEAITRDAAQRIRSAMISAISGDDSKD